MIKMFKSIAKISGFKAQKSRKNEDNFNLARNKWKGKQHWRQTDNLGMR